MEQHLYTVAQIRAIEEAAYAGLEPGALMRRAGRAAADHALELLEGRRDRPVLVLAGPGNNGGDALELAANLAEAGVDATVLHLPGRREASAETAAAYERARAGSVGWIDMLPPGADWALVVDGLFGIGLERPLEGEARELVEGVNALRCPMLALDVPSGLDADTGAVVGPDGVAVRATHTITFLGDKPGLHTGDGRDYAGEVRVDMLGVATADATAEAKADGETPLPRAAARLGGVDLFAGQLAARRHNSHKGSFGDVAVVGGAHGMAGAPVLAARGALFAGAGRVYVAALDHPPGYDSTQPEIMFRLADEFEFDRRTLVIGPGMGGSANAMRLLAKALDGDGPLVVDADALNLIGASPDLQSRLAQRKAPAVLTPHPLEGARLLGMTTAVVQADRLEAAREMALRTNAVVVLKGSGSVIARPDGEVVVNPTGNAGLATGGSGDVLAGICGALLAQGWPAWEAAAGAVWIHGAAADLLVEQGVGPIGMTAGELPAAARAVINRLVREAGAR
ncbi:bifunctional ADP-dependent (S)-NAD(P)H-hydrate dehydratase/NAD(P)H-hydrate epimerase [Massilia sp. KIM]|uniref:NAD(P)H-hydrate dehydratase n=1 Tax=Massilia sp. KIM TaxID=1955422 RepID=UPI00098F00D5|nr:NAD(P)H-hydrate dehydratase [Massilia sp. KIM]OON63096.1 bifunctional ADP-dependent (S)-NAD(P)H-hydrate dehydratase/NAD(P)H-hydrate epimerase [Massilia sp. KIM]